MLLVAGAAWGVSAAAADTPKGSSKASQAAEKSDSSKAKNAQASPDQADPDQAKPDNAGAGKPESAATKPDASGTNANGTKSGNKGDANKADAAKPPPAPPFDIDEYRVEGADSLPQIEVEEAVYPFLGPNKTADDVEKARAALEKAYHDKGYQTVTVTLPQQRANRGFVVLKVVENRVGQLRVKGSRFYDIDAIKKKATSLQEGKLPNFNNVTSDIVALNQQPDRRVTPALRAGVAPGTVDVDLNVEDTPPIHGSAELNNRNSANTTPLRFSATAHYDNLLQLGHSLTATYQVAPENKKDAEIFSVSYLARTNLDWLNILVYGLNSASNVASVGGSNVIGPGTTIGVRGVLTLPSTDQMVQTLQLGVDWKHFEEVSAGGVNPFSTPVTYVPAVAGYNATWQGDQGQIIQLDATITAGLRGFGSSPFEFDQKRFEATANFITLRSDVSYTRDLPGGGQLYLKGQGQVADQPLVSSEEISIGGLDTARGYFESEELGDFGGAATVELRSPSVAPYFTQKLKDVAKGQPDTFNPIDEWRFFAFGDVGRVAIFDPLVEQQSVFDMASYGIGTNFKFMKYGNGLILVAMPLISQQSIAPLQATTANKPHASFRFWGEF